MSEQSAAKCVSSLPGRAGPLRAGLVPRPGGTEAEQLEQLVEIHPVKLTACWFDGQSWVDGAVSAAVRYRHAIWIKDADHESSQILS